MSKRSLQARENARDRPGEHDVRQRPVAGTITDRPTGMMSGAACRGAGARVEHA
jgi:hypothetical protein